ncbi:hypothetical protein ACTSEZ_12105 [Metabacillus sp. JX24]|uniref:hypothetical protein n=1 Tax=Metabacillus sp. JX24 TaxID=3240759 RepID=UPI0035107573
MIGDILFAPGFMIQKHFKMEPSSGGFLYLMALISGIETINPKVFQFGGTYLGDRNHQSKDFPVWWHLSPG